MIDIDAFLDGTSDQPVSEIDSFLGKEERGAVPGRSLGTGGPGMDQQAKRGVLPLSGELIPAIPVQRNQPTPEPSTFDAEAVRQGIPDLRPDAVIVDGAGPAEIGRVPTSAPPAAEPRSNGTEGQTQPGQRPRFEQVLQRARGVQADPVALAAETGATRGRAARAIRP